MLDEGNVLLDSSGSRGIESEADLVGILEENVTTISRWILHKPRYAKHSWGYLRLKHAAGKRRRV